MKETVIVETRSQMCDGSGPYLLTSIQRVLLATTHNPGYNQDATCNCGHSYCRHFDTYEDMMPVGCKYCDCFTFTLKV